MNRIDRIFRDLRAQGGKALLPFLTAGDPDVTTTAALLPAMQQAGAAICELGIPFSDPIADGPVIQESMHFALTRGVRPADIFQAVASQRAALSMGVVAMVSFSIVHRMGVGSFIQQARAAGFDGFIFPDLPLEESHDVRAQVAQAGLTCSLLISPSTPLARAEQIARACTGFIYLMARAGLTGERASLPVDLTDRIARLRQVSDLPIAVGFGISTPQQVRQVLQAADAAIVGSAIVRRLTSCRQQPAQAVSEVTSFVQQLADGLVQDTAHK
ncbi:MAG: tryptophan synthase subunit alpha [Phycisphaeraceae bacterium]|nr:tryptophan synthase subunit alpha [Phycisphaeraceae bacterium]